MKRFEYLANYRLFRMKLTHKRNQKAPNLDAVSTVVDDVWFYDLNWHSCGWSHRSVMRVLSEERRHVVDWRITAPMLTNMHHIPKTRDFHHNRKIFLTLIRNGAVCPLPDRKAA
jgi:hypothetical protein